MAFKTSRKFFFTGPRTVKNFDEAYNIYVKEIGGKEEAENLGFLYKSALYKIFLESKYVGTDGPQKNGKVSGMSFEKTGGVRVDINKMEISPIDNTGAEDKRHVFDFYVNIEGAYGMDFPEGRLLEGYKMLNTLGDEVRDIFTNKLSRKTQGLPGETGRSI